MKKTFLLLGLLLSLLTSNAQNPVWSVAPNFIDYGDVLPQVTSLPQPTPPSALTPEEQEFYYYHGQSATAASNAQADASCFKL